MRTVHLTPGFKVSKLCAFNLMIFKINVHLNSLEASEMPPLRSLLGTLCSGAGLGPGVCIPQAPRWPSGGTGRSTMTYSSSCTGLFQLCSTRNYCHVCLSKHTLPFPFPSSGKSDLEGTGIQHQLGRHNDLFSLGPYPLWRTSLLLCHVFPDCHIENRSIFILNLRAHPFLF